MSSNRLKSLANQTAIYGFSSIFGKFLNYLLTPLYTYKISAATGGYGVVTNLYAITGLIMVILTFGMETTCFRFANKQGANPDKVFSTAEIAVGFLSLAFVLLVFMFLFPISKALDYSSNPEYVKILAVIVALDSFQSIMFARLRYENKAAKFATLKISFIIISIALNLFVFLVVPNLRKVGILLAYLASPDLREILLAMIRWYNPEYQVGYIFIINLICTGLITFGFIPEIKKLRRGLDRGLLKQMLRYSWPIVLLGLAGILNQNADKIFFRSFYGDASNADVELGIYGACVKISMIMTLITQAFRYAYEPFVFGSERDSLNKENQAKVMRYFIAITLFAFLAVVMYMPILKFFIGPGYWEGLRVVPIVMMAEIFMGIYFNLSFWYKLSDETWWGAVFSAIGCVVFLAINYIFVPYYSYMACAWAGFAGYAICMLLSFFVGQRKAPIPYDLKSVFTYFALAIALYLAQKYIHIDNTAWTLIVNTGLLLVYVALICWKERDLVKAIMPKASFFLKQSPK